jgi:hypothetical protein
MESESGYSFDVWMEWMDAHATRRDDGRVTHLDGRLLPESYRNTLTGWIEQCTDPVPLGRWDEILVRIGLMLITDFEHWCEEHCGGRGYLDSGAPPVVQSS